jgi:hypothetical protein
MRKVTYEIEGLTPYSQSKKLVHERQPDESYENFEARVWKQKATITPEGFVAIPSMAMKNALDIAARKAGERIPGKGMSTWTSRFEGGVSPDVDMYVLLDASGPIKIDEAKYVALWCDSTGKRGSGSRVLRYFPIFYRWSARISFFVLDDSIPAAVCDRFFANAGLIAGIGRFRPENGGTNGRWIVKSAVWENLGGASSTPQSDDETEAA